MRDSKASILTAATSEFTAHGLAGARVERIARQAGVNKQLLFYYFGSKAGLHAAVVDGLIELARTRAGSAPSGAGLPDVRLREAVGTLFRTLEAEPHLVRLSTQHADGGKNASFQQAPALLAGPIRQVVLEGQGIGFFRDDADPDFVANLAVSAVLGHLAAPGAVGHNSRSRSWSEALADLLVRGLAW